MPAGHEMMRGVAHPAGVRVLLVPLERGVARHGPAHRIHQPGVGAADLVDVGELPVDWPGAEAVDVAHGVLVARRAALGGGPVVGQQHHHGVVGLADPVEGGHEPAQVLVGVGEHPGVGLLHPGGHLLLVGTQLRPVGHTGVDGGQFGVVGDDPEVLLPGEPLLAEGPPAVVVASVVVVDGGLGGVQRVVAGAETQVEEEGSLGPRRGLGGDHGGGLVHQILGEVVAGPVGGVDVVVVGHQVGVPVVGGPVEEAVEPVEPPLQGPLVEGPGRGGVLDGG